MSKPIYTQEQLDDARETAWSEQREYYQGKISEVHGNWIFACIMTFVLAGLFSGMFFHGIGKDKGKLEFKQELVDKGLAEWYLSPNTGKVVLKMEEK